MCRMLTYDPVAMSVLTWVGFVKKEDPSKPRHYDLETTANVRASRACV